MAGVAEPARVDVPATLKQDLLRMLTSNILLFYCGMISCLDIRNKVGWCSY